MTTEPRQVGPSYWSDRTGFDQVIEDRDTLAAENERLRKAIQEAGALLDFQANLGPPKSQAVLREVVRQLTAALSLGGDVRGGIDDGCPRGA